MLSVCKYTLPRRETKTRHTREGSSHSGRRQAVLGPPRLASLVGVLLQPPRDFFCWSSAPILSPIRLKFLLLCFLLSFHRSRATPRYPQLRGSPLTVVFRFLSGLPASASERRGPDFSLAVRGWPGGSALHLLTLLLSSLFSFGS